MPGPPGVMVRLDPVQQVFTTRKLRAPFRSPKSFFPENEEMHHESDESDESDQMNPMDP